jgi:hypothetical protein
VRGDSAELSAVHLTFSASVWIHAEPARVFALISDPPRKAALNPNAQVIRVEQESEGLFESRAETDPPFEVRVTVGPAPEGCRA